MFPIIVEPGFELHVMQPSDAVELYEVIERNREYLAQWLSWAERTNSVQGVTDFIAKTAPQWEAGSAVAATIRLDGRIAGTIAIHEVDPVNHHTSLGYWLAAERQGRGIVTRACTAMVQLAFTHFKVHRVEIRCAVENHKSAAIPRRLGFVRDGSLRQALFLRNAYLDLEVYSMLKGEWR